MKFTRLHLLLLIFPLFLACETDEEEPEPAPIELEDPVPQILDLEPDRVKVGWEPVESAEMYQLDVYLWNDGDPVVRQQGYDNEVELDNFFYCSDSIRIVVFATAYQMETDKHFSSAGEMKFKMPACEYELVFKESKASAYCLSNLRFTNGFLVDIWNVTYDRSYVRTNEEHRDPLLIEVTSNIKEYDPAALDPGLGMESSPFFLSPPTFYDQTLCDHNPNTDIISLELSVKYRETQGHIPGSPMGFEVPIN